MSWFSDWRLKMHRNGLMRRLKNERVERVPGTFATATTFGILFDRTLPTSEAIIQEYAEELHKQGKKVELLAYVDDKERHAEFEYKHFNKRDLNFFFQPNVDIVTKFAAKKFDILLCLFTGDVLPLEYVAAISQANMRVGRYSDDKVHCYDLMIDTLANEDLKYLVKQADHFIKIVNAPRK